jgi:mevalonate kinase
VITASAPAKVILVGEHAVVYGKPAIAIPVSSIRATASVELGGRGLRMAVGDFAIGVDPAAVEAALTQMARLVAETLGTPVPGAVITIHSEIPVASGLGSGAAVSAALGRALSASLGHPLDNAALNPLVYEVEKLHHGTPSGIDNTVIVYEQPVYFVRGAPIETLPIGKPFCLLIGDTGRSALTRVAVGDVRKLYDSERERIQGVLDAIGSLVVDARQAIEIGDSIALGTLMVENHRLLEQLTVSSPELDRLVEIALSAGALGAKLSGGGRGGNMIALVQPDSATVISQALRQAGAQRVISTTVGS